MISNNYMFLSLNIKYLIFTIAFALAFILLYLGINILNKIKFGQAIRKLGPTTHQVKYGTPNIGGAIMIISVIIVNIFLLILSFDTKYIDRFSFKNEYQKLLMLFMPLIMYGTLGFIDDYYKAKKHTSDGLSPLTKLIFQIIWASIYFFSFLDFETTIINIFGKEIDLKWFYGVFILLCFVGTSNAFNLCDGIDGLSAGIALIILAFLLIICKDDTTSIFIISLIAVLCAFLIFNFHPAKIFMGDSGSLAIGATIANLFIILKIELLLLVFGLVMIIETLSVIIQVAYYKKTKKRVFLMTPLHHHFELRGYKEEKISIMFWIIQFIFGLLGLYLFHKYY